MNDHDVNFINPVIKVDPVVQNVIDKIGKVKKLSVETSYWCSVIPVQQPERRLPYYTRGKVADELERLESRGSNNLDQPNSSCTET